MSLFQILFRHLKKYLKDVCGAMVTMTLSALAVLYQPRLLEAIQKDLLKENTSKVVSDSIWIRNNCNCSRYFECLFCCKISSRGNE